MPSGGVEPPLLSETDFESAASADSATRAVRVEVYLLLLGYRRGSEKKETCDWSWNPH